MCLRSWNRAAQPSSAATQTSVGRGCACRLCLSVVPVERRTRLRGEGEHVIPLQPRDPHALLQLALTVTIQGFCGFRYQTDLAGSLRSSFRNASA